METFENKVMKLILRRLTRLHDCVYMTVFFEHRNDQN